MRRSELPLKHKQLIDEIIKAGLDSKLQVGQAYNVYVSRTIFPDGQALSEDTFRYLWNTEMYRRRVKESKKAILAPSEVGNRENFSDGTLYEKPVQP